MCESASFVQTGTTTLQDEHAPAHSHTHLTEMHKQQQRMQTLLSDSRDDDEDDEGEGEEGAEGEDDDDDDGALRVLEKREKVILKRVRLRLQRLARLRDSDGPEQLSQREFDMEKASIQMWFEAEKAELEQLRAQAVAQRRKRDLFRATQELVIERGKKEARALKKELGLPEADSEMSSSDLSRLERLKGKGKRAEEGGKKKKDKRKEKEKELQIIF